MLERVPSTPPRLMWGLAVACVVGQAGIAVTGASVRVTGSGLGCPTWPQCFPGSMVPVAHDEIAPLHQWIEFGNRLLGIALILVTGLTLLAALALRPRRRRLTLLAAVMPLGVILQAVIGGITVLTGLAWYTVAPHFLVTIPLIWCSVLLVRESGALHLRPDAPWTPTVARPARGLLAVTTAVLGVLLVVGTLVTAAGPHGGDPATPRLAVISFPTLVMTHVHVLFAFLGLLVGLGFLLHAVVAPPTVLRRFRLLVAITLAQGLLGGVQYALALPELLVALHVLGSVLTVVAAAALWAATRAPEDAVAPPDARDRVLAGTMT